MDTAPPFPGTPRCAPEDASPDASSPPVPATDAVASGQPPESWSEGSSTLHPPRRSRRSWQAPGRTVAHSTRSNPRNIVRPPKRFDRNRRPRRHAAPSPTDARAACAERARGCRSIRRTQQLPTSPDDRPAATCPESQAFETRTRPSAGHAADPIASVARRILTQWPPGPWRGTSTAESPRTRAPRQPWRPDAQPVGAEHPGDAPPKDSSSPGRPAPIRRRSPTGAIPQPAHPAQPRQTPPNRGRKQTTVRAATADRPTAVHPRAAPTRTSDALLPAGTCVARARSPSSMRRPSANLPTVQQTHSPTPCGPRSALSTQTPTGI